MENLSEDQSIEMEENIPQTPSDQQKCNHLKSIDRQIELFNIRKGYVAQLLDVEKRNPGPTPETTLKLEEEAAGLDEHIKALEALNSADKDVEDVTPAAPRIKPIMMNLFPEYNLILQDIHRTHPTATNTHIGGWIKIQAESSDHHREIT
ncbi:hypothetical protein TNCV_3989321 [Trichonephila clavipes]|nr:hypothetical protein TNCV_3989321 [Trichonephila clavipes]